MIRPRISKTPLGAPVTAGAPRVVITKSHKAAGDDVVVTGTHRDQDIHKGAMEEDRPGPERPDAPALDAEGLPNDKTAIAQDALGAAVDQSQG